MFCIHWNNSGTQLINKRFEWFFFNQLFLRGGLEAATKLMKCPSDIAKVFLVIFILRVFIGQWWRKLAITVWLLFYVCAVGTSKSYSVLTPKSLSFLAHGHFPSFPGFLSIKCLSNSFDIFLLGGEYCEFCENAIMNTGLCFSYLIFLVVSIIAMF